MIKFFDALILGLLLSFVAFVACVSVTTTASSEPAPIIADWDHVPQAAEWTQITTEAINEFGQEMLAVIEPTDFEEFCPNFPNLDEHGRIQFYTMLLSSMARFESGFKPESSYQEAFPDAQGRPVVSRGLLQLSIESGNGYGCNFKTIEDVHDPRQNLRCSVRILSRWVARDQCFGCMHGEKKYRGAGRYWSVMRPGKKQNLIKQKMMSSSFCQLPPA